jgi:hypothetical protein
MKSWTARTIKTRTHKRRANIWMNTTDRKVTGICRLQPAWFVRRIRYPAAVHTRDRNMKLLGCFEPPIDSSHSRVNWRFRDRISCRICTSAGKDTGNLNLLFFPVVLDCCKCKMPLALLSAKFLLRSADYLLVRDTNTYGHVAPCTNHVRN